MRDEPSYTSCSGKEEADTGWIIQTSQHRTQRNRTTCSCLIQPQNMMTRAAANYHHGLLTLLSEWSSRWDVYGESPKWPAHDHLRLSLKRVCVAILNSLFCRKPNRKMFLKVSVCSALSNSVASNCISGVWSLISLKCSCSCFQTSAVFFCFFVFVFGCFQMSCLHFLMLLLHNKSF